MSKEIEELLKEVEKRLKELDEELKEAKVYRYLEKLRKEKDICLLCKEDRG